MLSNPQGDHLKAEVAVDRIDPDAKAFWMALTPEQREDMFFQTQSFSYAEWMAEEDWEETPQT